MLFLQAPGVHPEGAEEQVRRHNAVQRTEVILQAGRNGNVKMTDLIQTAAEAHGTSPCSLAPSSLNLCQVGFMSARLVYLALNQRFVVPIFEHFTAAVTRFMVPRAPHTLGEARDMVADTLDAMRAGHHLTLAVCSRQQGEFLGCLALNGVGTSNPEVGIWLKGTAQGQGVGTEALGSLLAWYQKHFVAEGYIYPADRRNVASCRLAQRLGGRLVRRYLEPSQHGYALDVAEFMIPPVRVRQG